MRQPGRENEQIARYRNNFEIRAHTTHTINLTVGICTAFAPRNTPQPLALATCEFMHTYARGTLWDKNKVGVRGRLRLCTAISYVKYC